MAVSTPGDLSYLDALLTQTYRSRGDLQGLLALLHRVPERWESLDQDLSRWAHLHLDDRPLPTRKGIVDVLLRFNASISEFDPLPPHQRWQIALTIYDQALQVYTADLSPRKWQKLQQKRAEALQKLQYWRELHQELEHQKQSFQQWLEQERQQWQQQKLQLQTEVQHLQGQLEAKTQELAQVQGQLNSHSASSTHSPSDPSESARPLCCPRCSSAIGRRRKKGMERIVSSLLNLQPYRCENPLCSWQGWKKPPKTSLKVNRWNTSPNLWPTLQE